MVETLRVSRVMHVASFLVEVLVGGFLRWSKMSAMFGRRPVRFRPGLETASLAWPRYPRVVRWYRELL